MTSTIVPPVDLAPGMPSRVVTISATDVTEGGQSLEGQMVRFALSDTLDVSSGGDVIAKTQAEVVLDANGEGRIRLPVYTDAVKTWCGDPDWAILVTATWGSQKAIRVPAGTSSIALSALPSVRPLRGRERQWAITGVDVSVSVGDPSTSSGSYSGGILGLSLRVPAGIWSKPAPAGANFNEYYTDTHSGHWYFTAGGAGNMSGLPAGYGNRAGSILVLGAGFAAQFYLPYGFYSTEILTRFITNVSTHTWSPWAPIGGADDNTPFVRGTFSTGTDLNQLTTAEKAGLWHFSQATSNTLGGLPDGAAGKAGQVLILSSGIATQIYMPYGFFGDSIKSRAVKNASTGEWTDWVPLGGGGGASGAGVGPWVQNSIRKTMFMQAMGGPIDTGGKAAVALRFDHGLTNFRDKVLPLTKARGIKVSQAYNPRNWHYDENAGVTATDLNGWVAAGDVEIWNHSANHLDASDEAALEDTIVGGLAEIEAELPAARGKVWGFAPPGVDQENGYGGFGNGNSPEKWDTPAGRLILQHHAVASAYLPGTSIRPLDGTVRDGQSHITMDSISVATIKGYIDQAIAQRGGLQLMLHPSQLDQSGKLTTAQLTEVLDYIVAKRSAGELATLSPYEMAVADSTGSRDSGDLDITSALAGVTSGKVWLTRIGQQVWLDFQNVVASYGGSFVVWDGAIPTGYRPSRQVDLPMQGRTSGDPPGPARVSSNGQVVVYRPAGTIRGLISWFTREAPPA